MSKMREPRTIFYATLTLAFAFMVPVLILAVTWYSDEEKSLGSQIPAAWVLLGVGAAGLITCFLPRRVKWLATLFDNVIGLVLAVAGLYSMLLILNHNLIGWFKFTQAYAGVFFFVGSFVVVNWGARAFFLTQRSPKEKEAP